MDVASHSRNVMTGVAPWWHCREQGEGRRRRGVSKEERQEEDRGAGRVLRCRSCGHPVTSRDRAIEVAGGHRHTFFNPAGIVFELGCFAAAPGCAVAGIPTDEFSWFAGHVWRVALCGGCGRHLGWKFSSGDGGFYGLILPQLVEDDR